MIYKQYLCSCNPLVENIILAVFIHNEAFSAVNIIEVEMRKNF